MSCSAVSSKPLRSQFVFPTLRKALAKATRARKDFRITQFSVQGDHLHLIVEAGSNTALSRGMQGLAIPIARAVNALVSRSGKVWADRLFARELQSPRAIQAPKTWLGARGWPRGGHILLASLGG